MSDFNTWYEVAEYLLSNKWNSVDVASNWSFTQDKSWSKVYPPEDKDDYEHYKSIGDAIEEMMYFCDGNIGGISKE